MTIYSQFRESTTYLKLGMQREGNNIPSKIALSKSTYTYWEQDSFPTQIFFCQILKNNPSLYVTSTSCYLVSPNVYTAFLLYGLCYVVSINYVRMFCIRKVYTEKLLQNDVKKHIYILFFKKRSKPGFFCKENCSKN